MSNCKPGDLAIVVSAENLENIGKIIRCIELHRNIPLLGANGIWYTDAWDFEGNAVGWDNKATGLPTLAPDAWIRPIRDQDGTDEMIRIAGLPQEQGVKA